MVGLCNVPAELRFAAERTYCDPFNDVELDVIFAGPSGREWRVPAFWAGGGEFRVRFAAPEPGRYTWRSVCTNPGDPGLHGRSGEIEVEPYDGDNPLYVRGRLRVSKNRRTLEHADGRAFVWLGDTWWMGLARRLDWPDGFNSLAADRVAKGFNLIQIVAGPLPDFDAASASFHPQQANEAGWSWEEGWTRINPAYYEKADRRIARLVELGLVPCLVGMWGYYLLFMGIEKAKKHWRNLVARYGAYPVVWCLAGEAKMPTYSRFSVPGAPEADRAALAEGWTDVARYLRGVDPYGNVLTVHPTGLGAARDMLLDESLLDLDMLQTSHGGHAVLRPTFELTARELAREPRMPVVNGEPCYEGIMGTGRDEMQRFIFWTSIVSGAAGHTYGAQGIWAMSSRDEPFVGTTANWGDGFWQDVMLYPGSAHLGIGKRFLEGYPWHLFAPRGGDEVAGLGRVSDLMVGIPGAVWLAYLAGTWAEAAFAGVQGTSIRLESDGFRAFFFNPRTGGRIEIGPARCGPDGTWPVPAKPSMDDWVLVLEDPRGLLAGR